jgi:hypothetical protein
MTKIGRHYQQGDDIYRVIETSERPFLRLQNVRTDAEVKVYLEDLEKQSYIELQTPDVIKSLQDQIDKLLKINTSTEDKTAQKPQQEARGG